MNTYSNKEFTKLINEILNNAGYDLNVRLLKLKNQTAKKWYDKEYDLKTDIIEENTIYGVYITDDISNDIEFEFKTGKIDNLLKSFITNFSRKHKSYELGDDDFIKQIDNKTVFNNIITKNHNRVYKQLFYTTLYGIGFWALFSTEKDVHIANDLKKYLNENGIKFTNEFSDAQWVYRFKINKDVTIHNQLLENFKIS